MVKTDYTREELIAICERAIVPQKEWRDRDSFESQKQIGEALVLLKCGCKFQVQVATGNPKESCVTDEGTIWLKFWAQTFMWFENCDEDSDSDGYEVDDHYYLPTPKRLEDKAGKDWY